MAEEIRQKVEMFNEALAGKFPYRFDVVDPAAIHLLEKNARYMDQPTFQQLVDNVKRDGALSSLPLCHRNADGRLEVLSGNHRVQAAVHASLEEIIVLVVDRDLSRDEQIAIQLSHNSLAGKDDMSILRDLWEELSDIEFKQYAGLDSETLGQLQKLEFTTLADPSVRTEQLIFQFLPEEKEELNLVIEQINEKFSRDNNYIMSLEHYDAVFSGIVAVKEKFGIVNNPTAIMKIFELAMERLPEIPDPVKPEKKSQKKEKEQKPEE